MPRRSQAIKNVFKFGNLKKSNFEVRNIIASIKKRKTDLQFVRRN